MFVLPLIAKLFDLILIATIVILDNILFILVEYEIFLQVNLYQYIIEYEVCLSSYKKTDI